MIYPSDANIVNVVAELIKLSVGPVFLLAAVAGLLNVFTGRLTRIIDKVDKLEELDDKEKNEEKRIKRHKFLTMRMKNVNYAIFFCTCTGLLVAMVIALMFLSSIMQFESTDLISSLFVLAMLCLIISLLVFLREIYYTTYFIRSKKNLYKSSLKTKN